MNDRERIFSAIREALAPIEEPAARPDLDPAQWRSEKKLSGGGTWDDFTRNFEAVNGKVLTSFDALAELLGNENATEGYADPALRPLFPEAFSKRLTLHDRIDRSAIDRYAFGITKAHAAIAETGTLMLRDTETPDRLGALAPWVHIAVVDRNTLFDTVAAAIADLGDDPNTIWVTGPSKTADVEGILIEGVHGPGVQVCLLPDETAG